MPDTPPSWFNPISIALLVIAAGHILWRIARWTHKTDQGLKDLPKAVRRIQKDLAAVRKRVEKLFSEMPRQPVASNSPMQLTEFGEEISKSLKAEDWAAATRNGLFDEVDGMEPYEVDEFCAKYVKERLNEEWRKRIAACAYQFGIEREGIESVLRVVLRNKLLSLMFD